MAVELILDPEDEPLRKSARLRHLRGGHVYAFIGQVPLHRVIMGSPPRLDIDHRNGDTLDNRKANLRVVSRSVNNQNSDRRMPHDPAKTPFKGVSRHVSGLWLARIKLNGRTVSCGYHVTSDEANQARLRKELELWGVQPRRKQAFIDAGVITP